MPQCCYVFSPESSHGDRFGGKTPVSTKIIITIRSPLSLHRHLRALSPKFDLLIPLSDRLSMAKNPVSRMIVGISTAMSPRHRGGRRGAAGPGYRRSGAPI